MVREWSREKELPGVLDGLRTSDRNEVGSKADDAMGVHVRKRCGKQDRLTSQLLVLE